MTSKKHKLPVAQLTILSLCRFAEPIALTSVFPYLPEMVESFGVRTSEVGKWVGLTSAVFSLAQAATAIPWARASDIYGRRVIILIGTISTMTMFVLWGFSTSLTMAIVVRALQGALNGNVGIIRTMVAEICPWKELQPRAFSLMPIVWSTGSIFGPALGGILSNPYKVRPGHPHGNALLERFPYALPNIVAALIFGVGITIGFLFLQETLSSMKGHRDVGLRLGDKILNSLRTAKSSKKEDQEDETNPLLKQPDSPRDEEAAGSTPKLIPTTAAPTFKEIATFQSMLVLAVYTLLAMFDIGYHQLLPVLMHHPRTCDPQTYQYCFDQSPPFLFSNGMGLSNRLIGLVFTASGVFSMLGQFFIFPILANKFGSLACLRTCLLLYPFIYILTPFTVLLPTSTAQQAGIFTFLLLKQGCSIFMFPCCIILLTNSVRSVRILGPLNGLATSTSGLGRAGGPVLGGWLFTIGAQRNFIILPFIVLALVAMLAWIPAYFMVEGKGIANEEEEEEGAEE